jgi:hypothetical protein
VALAAAPGRGYGDPHVASRQYTRILRERAIMFDHVMVALDLSPAADLMLRCLPGLRELGTRRLTLVHVAEVDYPVFGAVAHLDQHRERLEGLVPAIRAAGF